MKNVIDIDLDSSSEEKSENIFLNNKGNINHMSQKGNDIIYKKIKKILNEKETISK